MRDRFRAAPDNRPATPPTDHPVSIDSAFDELDKWIKYQQTDNRANLYADPRQVSFTIKHTIDGERMLTFKYEIQVGTILPHGNVQPDIPHVDNEMQPDMALPRALWSVWYIGEDGPHDKDHTVPAHKDNFLRAFKRMYNITTIRGGTTTTHIK